MFTNVIDGVEVFEVGKSQIIDLLGAYADIDAANDHWQSIGFAKEIVAALVMVEQYEDGSYGNVGLLTFVTSSASVNEIVEAEREFDSIHDKTVIYEVWYVVDDVKQDVSSPKPTRYYYAASHDYDINFCNDIHYLHRFSTCAARDKYVSDESWDGRGYKIESLARDQARQVCSGAFGPRSVVLEPVTGRDLADLDMVTYQLSSDGYYPWVVQPDGSQLFDCYE